jgi:hypothetical protein
MPCEGGITYDSTFRTSPSPPTHRRWDWGSRTRTSHLRHVYNKAGLTSRVEPANEATRH